MKSNSKLEILIFVYNADSGIFSIVSDFAHKVISPETYACNLCKLTYGNFIMKKQWRDFIEGLDIKKQFYHKDEFCMKYPESRDQKLPTILGFLRGELTEIIGADELNNLNNLDSLKNILKQRLAS